MCFLNKQNHQNQCIWNLVFYFDFYILIGWKMLWKGILLMYFQFQLTGLQFLSISFVGLEVLIWVRFWIQEISQFNLT